MKKENEKQQGKDTETAAGTGAEPSARAEGSAADYNAPVGAYASHGYHDLDLSRNRWDDEYADHAGQLVRDTPQGRLAIRCFSRGVLGALCYAGGQRYAGKQMATYHPERLPENWVQVIARCFDTGAGKPLKAAVNLLGGDGHGFVTFRPTRKFYGGMQDGRTLGHEIVAVTFDFASMSVGDAAGRDLALLVDPNVKHTWKREDGSIDVPQTLKTLASRTFRYLTYNQGEDWAVALPYVFYLRWQRNMINKFSPGFAYDSDRNLNGGSFKVDDKGRVVGNYMLEGLLDLQGRFTAYNIGTLMFREVYLDVADKLLTWSTKGYPMPSIDPAELTPGKLAENAKEGVKQTLRWAGRDIIKGGLYMTPSVPFFWLTRTPQTRYRGVFIHPEKGVMTYKSGTRPWPFDIDVVHANEVRRDSNKQRMQSGSRIPFTPETPVAFSRYDGHTGGWNADTVRETLSTEINPMRHGPFNPYDQASHGLTDSALNAIGKWNNKARKLFHGPIEKLRDSYGVDITKRHLKRDMDNYVNAAVSYTPYFWSKAEFAKLWDNARMDMSIERMLDGAATFDWREFKGGAHEVWRSLKLEPLPEPVREDEAKERVRTDLSPADIFDPKIFQTGYSRAFEHHDHPAQASPPPAAVPAAQTRPSRQGFVERLHSHKQHALSRMEQFKRAEAPTSYAAAVAPSANADAPRPSSFAEQEVVRQVTRSDFPSPGTTVH